MKRLSSIASNIPFTVTIIIFHFIVTEPYLKVFRKRIPKIGNFDISTIPAVIILDVFGQATAALGSEFPHQKMLKKNTEILEKPIKLYNDEKSNRLKSFHTFK
jgi:uncharacterized protein YggT (Ycf19 family)